MAKTGKPVSDPQGLTPIRGGRQPVWLAKPLISKEPKNFQNFFQKKPKVPQTPAVTVFRSPVKGLLFGILE
ncbi:hypothetical protein [Pseudoduganella sp. R-43]|uniref:hypothetical protein n=1 Tax=Pseudoduganella sp. R-43 TaxID=3404063 RepID=UPI003CEC96DB